MILTGKHFHFDLALSLDMVSYLLLNSVLLRYFP